MKRDLWTDIKAVLLYEAGFTLAEVGRYCSGVSKQCIQQRFIRIGYKTRPPGRGGGEFYPEWQKKLIRRVRAMGLSGHETAELLSLRSQNLVYRLGGEEKVSPMARGGFRTRLAASAWIECRDTILAAARLDGATHAEIIRLAGFKRACESTILLARKFPNMPSAVPLKLLLKMVDSKKDRSSDEIRGTRPGSRPLRSGRSRRSTS